MLSEEDVGGGWMGRKRKKETASEQRRKEKLTHKVGKSRESVDLIPPLLLLPLLCARDPLAHEGGWFLHRDHWTKKR